MVKRLQIRQIMGQMISRQIGIEEIHKDDKVIVVIGSTGAGKSTFINTAVGREEFIVGHTLSPCTKEVAHVLCIFDNKRVVLVDTPAFNSETQSKVENKIQAWLKRCEAKVEVAGILYLHSMSTKKIVPTEAPLTQVQMFKNLIKEDPYSGRVVLVTTMWKDNNRKLLIERESELLEKYWNKSPSVRFHGTTESARRAVQTVLGEIFE